MSRYTREERLERELADAQNLLCLQTEEIRILQARVASLEETIEAKGAELFIDHMNEWANIQEHTK